MGAGSHRKKKVSEREGMEPLLRHRHSSGATRPHGAGFRSPPWEGNKIQGVCPSARGVWGKFNEGGGGQPLSLLSWARSRCRQ